MYILVSFGVAAAGAGLRWWRKRALAGEWRRRRVSAIGSATEGEVVLVGRARGAEPLLSAPLTGRTCIAYKVVVIADRDAPPVAVDTRCVRFELTDDSGTALITDRDGELQLATDWSVTAGGTTEPLNRQLAEYLATIGQKATFWRTLRLEESVIADDTPVAVLGIARRVSDPDPQRVDHYRELPTRLAVEGSAARPLWINGDPALVARLSESRQSSRVSESDR